MVPRFAKYRALATAFSAKLVPRSRSASSGNRSRNWSTGNVSSNGRPVNRSRISRILPSLRVATNNFIAGSSRRLAAQPREQLGRRSAGHQRHTHHPRSEEHTSELQSRLHLVCRLLLEKKKKTQ